MKSYDMLIKQILVGAILLVSTAVNAADQTTTTTTAPAAAATTPAATTTTTTTATTPAAVPAPINPANVNTNDALQKCMDSASKDANGAPNRDDMIACTKKNGAPTNIVPAQVPKPKTAPATGN